MYLSLIIQDKNEIWGVSSCESPDPPDESPVAINEQKDSRLCACARLHETNHHFALSKQFIGQKTTLECT